MDIQNEIIQTIDLMIDKRLKDKKIPLVFQSVVVGIKKDKYIVTINGTEKALTCSSGKTLSPGNSVWVCMPYGDVSKAFIIGSL